MAIKLPESKEIEYVADGVNILTGVERKGSTFDFYLKGDVNGEHVDVAVSENYKSMASLMKDVNYKVIADRFNEALLSEHDFIIPGERLAENIKKLLNYFGL